MIIDSSMLGRAGDDPAVGGHPAAGPDDDQVADASSAGATEDDPVAVDPLGLVGQQRGQRVQRGGGLGQRAHLDPVAEQHDDDQQRQLPPEVEVVIEQSEAGAPGGEEGDGDGQRDQQHHPGLRGRGSRSTAPVRNGGRPTTYMTVPSTGETHATQPASGRA